MRITTTDEYKSHRLMGSCPHGLDDCDGQYCKTHRTLYQVCETATKTHMGSGEIVFEEQSCPQCMDEERVRKWTQLARNLP